MRLPLYSSTRPISRISCLLLPIRPREANLNTSFSRPFSCSSKQQSWLLPVKGYSKKIRKGRPRVRTAGSVKGTTVVWGDYGLRMTDKHRRVSAAQLKIGEDVIKRRLKGERFKFYARVSADTPVFTSGNEVRMGKGKGSFDHFASRIAVNRIIFEVEGNMHEQVIREAFRLAAAKMPGQYEFVKRGDPPVMGTTKMVPGITREVLFRPRLKKLEPTTRVSTSDLSSGDNQVSAQSPI